MNDIQIHLIANHLPLALPFIGLLVLILSIAVKSRISRRIAYLLIALGGILTLPAFFSGEGAEEIAEQMHKNHDLIHEHEEKAELFAYINYLLASLSAFGLWMSWKKKEMEKYVFLLVLAGTIAVCVLAFCTGESGGEISHPEIHSE